MTILTTLETLYQNCPHDAWTTVGFANAKKEYLPQAFQIRDLESLAGLVLENTEHHVYVNTGVYAAKPVGGKEVDLLGTNKVHVDIDSEKIGETIEFSINKVMSQRWLPSLIVNSGHGIHVYWFLREFTEDWRAVKERNNYLHELFKADDKFAVNSMLRLPGTFNIKNGERILCEIVYRSEEVYDLDDFPALPIRERIVAQDIYTKDLPEDFEQQLRKLRGGDRVWKRIFSEETARSVTEKITSGERAGQTDRSKNDQAIATWLLFRKFDHETVASVLRHPTWFSGEKYREKGGESGRRYVINSIEKAAIYVAERTAKYTVTDENEKFAPFIAAEEIIKGANVTGFCGVGYAYTGTAYTDDLSVVVDSILEESIGTGIRMNQIREVEQFIERKIAVDMNSNFFNEASEHFINVENGLLDISTGTLYPHDPGIFTPGRIPATWNPDIGEEYIEEANEFVASIIDDENVPFLWEQVSLSFSTAAIKWAGILVLLGDPNHGKSQIIDFVTGLIGLDNVSALDPSDLTGQDKFAIASLVGKRANYVQDSNCEVLHNSSLMKVLLNSQITDINRKYRNRVKGRIFARMIIATNKQIAGKSVDAGFLDRYHVIECKNKFSSDMPGFKLAAGQELISRPEIRSAALLLAVRGYQRMMSQKGYTKTESMQQAFLNHQVETGSVAAFWMACSEDDPEAEVARVTVKRAYMMYCEELGYSHPVGPDAFKNDTLTFAQVNKDLGFNIEFHDTSYSAVLQKQTQFWKGRRLKVKPVAGIQENGKVHVGLERVK